MLVAPLRYPIYVPRGEVDHMGRSSSKAYSKTRIPHTGNPSRKTGSAPDIDGGADDVDPATRPSAVIGKAPCTATRQPVQVV
jgi:hypothetical protein